MIKNFLLTSIRNLSRFKLYSFLNILGLAIGFTSFILIFIYVKHEVSFDQFHEKKETIVKANLKYGPGPDETEPLNLTPTALLPVMLRTFPEVTGGTRYFNPSSFRPSNVSVDKTVFQEKEFAYADSTFFKIFTYHFISGDPATALVEPNSLVLTETAAHKYFAGKDPVGKELIINNLPFLVKGLMEDVPDNSHLKFTMLGSFSTLSASKKEIWGSANYFTYLTLTSREAIEDLAAKTEQLLLDLEVSQPDQGFYADIKLVPLTDVYLRSEADAYSDIKYVYIFSAIALIILLIASINYMNLATARSVMRAREVGIRKVSGAGRFQLIIQFISEAIIIALISLLISYLVVYLSFELFSNLSGKDISRDLLFDLKIAGPIIAASLLVGLLSGLYPAIILSSFKPVSILKGNFGNSGHGAMLRKLLVVFQFSISIFMIIATLVISNQLSFIQNRDLGYEKNAVIAIPINRSLMDKAETVKTTLINTGHVESAAMAGETPVSIRGGYSIWGEGMSENLTLGTTAIPVDEDFITTFSIPLTEGTDFERMDILRTAQEENPEYSFILNHKASEMMGWSPEEAIGKNVLMNGRAGKVKGVINDFHFQSLHQEIGPLVLFTEESWAYNYTLLKLKSINRQVLSDLENTWKDVAPDLPFSYEFINDEFNQLYQSEGILGQLIASFSVIAILVACLGLFGLASFTSFQRSKEISIRKVLGASSDKLVLLLSKDFVVLVIIAFFIAAPAGYFVMNNWLQDFEYRTEITQWQIIGSLIITGLITFLTVSYHALRSANANPADVLKNE